MFVEVPILFGVTDEVNTELENLGIAPKSIETEVDTAVINVEGIERFNRHTEEDKTSVFMLGGDTFTVMLPYGKFKDLIQTVSRISKSL